MCFRYCKSVLFKTNSRFHFLPITIIFSIYLNRFNISEAIAKLNFHQNVTEDDCVLAICLYQESLKHNQEEIGLTKLSLNLQHITQIEKNNVRIKEDLFFFCCNFILINNFILFLNKRLLIKLAYFIET